ncbi:hypothetical protein HK096_011331 [Nowakowskiella sp. JEL0078]|nr:hypothetical protein HK096_011331 [Nowakowskiella sp. JEL0078]
MEGSTSATSNFALPSVDMSAHNQTSVLESFGNSGSSQVTESQGWTNSDSVSIVQQLQRHQTTQQQQQHHQQQQQIASLSLGTNLYPSNSPAGSATYSLHSNLTPSGLSSSGLTYQQSGYPQIQQSAYQYQQSAQTPHYMLGNMSYGLLSPQQKPSQFVGYYPQQQQSTRYSIATPQPSQQIQQQSRQIISQNVSQLSQHQQPSQPKTFKRTRRKKRDDDQESDLSEDDSFEDDSDEEWGTPGARSRSRNMSGSLPNSHNFNLQSSINGGHNNQDSSQTRKSANLKNEEVLVTVSRSGRRVVKPKDHMLIQTTTGKKRGRAAQKGLSGSYSYGQRGPTSSSSKNTMLLDPSHVFCARCCAGDSDEANDAIVLCDGCDTPYHQRCHDPQIADHLVQDEKEKWFCSNCTRKRDEISILADEEAKLKHTIETQNQALVNSRQPLEKCLVCSETLVSIQPQPQQQMLIGGQIVLKKVRRIPPSSENELLQIMISKMCQGCKSKFEKIHNFLTQLPNSTVLTLLMQTCIRTPEVANFISERDHTHREQKRQLEINADKQNQQQQIIHAQALMAWKQQVHQQGSWNTQNQIPPQSPVKIIPQIISNQIPIAELSKFSARPRLVQASVSDARIPKRDSQIFDELSDDESKRKIQKKDKDRPEDKQGWWSSDETSRELIGTYEDLIADILKKLGKASQKDLWPWMQSNVYPLPDSFRASATQALKKGIEKQRFIKDDSDQFSQSHFELTEIWTSPENMGFINKYNQMQVKGINIEESSLQSVEEINALQTINSSSLGPVHVKLGGFNTRLSKWRVRRVPFSKDTEESAKDEESTKEKEEIESKPVLATPLSNTQQDVFTDGYLDADCDADAEGDLDEEMDAPIGNTNDHNESRYVGITYPEAS